MPNQLLSTLDPVAPGVPFQVAARCYWINAGVLTLIHQADISGAIAWTTYRKLTRDTWVLEATGTLTVASTIYDALQTGNAWTRDAVGYNLLAKIPSLLGIGSGAPVYIVELTFTLSGGDAVKLGWLVPILDMQ